jgi:CRP/FNR family cyclic AMP-dependent transcriptional regulator
MVSTELLRRYPFFAGLTDSQLKAVANLAQESHYPTGSTIFEECHVASHLFILLEGSVELYYRSQEEFYPTSVKEFFVGEINPGEAFGTSSMIPPYELNATARTPIESRFIEINSTELLKLMAQDLELANILLLQVIKTLQDRMGSLRIQLAAAQS